MQTEGREKEAIPNPEFQGGRAVFCPLPLRERVAGALTDIGEGVATPTAGRVRGETSPHESRFAFFVLLARPLTRTLRSLPLCEAPPPSPARREGKTKPLDRSAIQDLLARKPRIMDPMDREE